MKEYSLKQLLVVAFSTLMFFGCHMATTDKQGMLNENTYFSSKKPNIQIVVDDLYQYSEEADSYDHKFINVEKHRVSYILHSPSNHDQRKIEYYYSPDSWLFNDYPTSIRLHKGELEIIGKTWYYQDCVLKPTTANCVMIRDIGMFTPTDGLFKILYIFELPPYTCNQWNKSESFTDEQEEAYKNFLEGFASDIKITNYQG
ncbi:hypothetical protein OAT93_02000 [bacterium]|nr:hypothetical protein [bacterium]